MESLSRPKPLAQLVATSPGAVVSRVLARSGSGTLTAFAFDGGEGLSEHSAPFDAFLIGIEGRARVTVGGEPEELRAGEIVRLPAEVPHAIEALEPFKMLLVMLKGR